MGGSLRVTIRQAVVGSTPVCLLARSAHKPTKFESVLDPRFAGEIDLKIRRSVRPHADEVIT
jgi:hypothetical protein